MLHPIGDWSIVLAGGRPVCGPEEVGLILADRQHDDGDFGMALLDPGRGLNTRHIWHLDVHEDQVGPERVQAMPPDELRLRRARDVLNDFGALWREPAVPDRLREQALHELFVRFDVERGTLVAAHAQPNENAWLLGQALLKAGLLPMHRLLSLVGARGFEPPVPKCRIVVPPAIEMALKKAG